ncbi:MAG: hypothetical protein AAFV19_20240 [Pseudomonadota bacterium]
MLAKRLAGPGAGVRKYDLLTALAVAGLAGSPGFATSMTRLIALVTARYNWRLDEVTIGQAELARMWSVDVRTVKREIRRLAEHGLLSVKRAGVRGRVATYILNHARIDELTRDCWPLVGPDFEARMTEQGRGADTPPGSTTVVPFPGQTEPATEWAAAKAALRRSDRARAKAWFDPLLRDDRVGDHLILRAPSAFHAEYVTTHLIGDLVRAVTAADPSVDSLDVIA